MELGIVLKMIGAIAATGALAGGMIKYIQSRHDKALYDHKESVDIRLTETARKVSSVDKLVSKELKSFEHRLSEVEGEIKHLPDKADIGRLFSRLDEVNGNIQKVAGGQEALSTQVALINDHLINRERKP